MKNKSIFTSPPPMLAGAGWLFVGFVAAAMLFVDPFGAHPVDEWIRGHDHAAMETAAGEPAAAAGETGLWTCGMHPEVLQNEPGTCPICQMDLVPLRVAHETADAESHEGHGDEPAAAAELWRCPVHPTVEEDGPGECPIGGRALERAREKGATDHSAHQGTVVEVDSAVVQKMNVRTQAVVRRPLEHRIRSVGYLEYDQASMVTVTTKYSGWVDKVYVNYVGEKVTKGLPLFEVYSPELVQTEEELLSALRYAERLGGTEDTARRAAGLVEAAKQRLRYWDISDDQIERLVATGEVFRTLTVTAPASGVVMKRMKGLEGMAVRPGMDAYHIADLSSLWLMVEVFEDQVTWIAPETPAEIHFSSFPDRAFRGAVRFIEPEISEKTRTLRAKVEITNPDGRLRAGMYASVIFEPPSAEEALVVPSLAVLRTGERDLVVVDLGGGRFAPRHVGLGHEQEGYVEVLSGLDEGERVVTSSQFLLDSESNLREAIQKMIAEAGSDDVDTSAMTGHQH